MRMSLCAQLCLSDFDTNTDTYIQAFIVLLVLYQWLDIENRCFNGFHKGQEQKSCVFMVAGVILNGRHSNNSVYIYIFWSVAPLRERMRITVSRYWLLFLATKCGFLLCFLPCNKAWLSSAFLLIDAWKQTYQTFQKETSGVYFFQQIIKSEKISI